MSDFTTTDFYRLLRGYEREYEVGLIRMIAAVSGRKLIEEHGKEQPDNSYVNDGVYVAIFEGGVGIAVEYSAETAGYSEYTPGSPPRVEYSLLRRRGGA